MSRSEWDETIAAREARLTWKESGVPIGVAVFVTADELDKMGIDLEGPSIAYRIGYKGIRFR